MIKEVRPLSENQSYPLYWQRVESSNFDLLFDAVSQRGFNNRNKFLLGHILGIIVGDDINFLAPGCRSAEDIDQEIFDETSPMARVQFLGRVAFELSCPNLPLDLRDQLEKVYDFVFKNPWITITDLWQTKIKYLKIVEFVRKRIVPIEKYWEPHTYALKAEMSLLENRSSSFSS